MSSFIFLLVSTILPYLRAATALPPSNTTGSDKIHPLSSTLNARASSVCVDAVRNPDWAGAIDPMDCADAIGRLWDRVLPYGYTQWTFWASVVERPLKSHSILTNRSRQNSSRTLRRVLHGKFPKGQTTVSLFISFRELSLPSNELTVCRKLRHCFQNGEGLGRRRFALS